MNLGFWEFSITTKTEHDRKILTHARNASELLTLLSTSMATLVLIAMLFLYKQLITRFNMIMLSDFHKNCQKIPIFFIHREWVTHNMFNYSKMKNNPFICINCTA